MIYITPYSIIEVCHNPEPIFPKYIYHLIAYNEIDPHGSKAKDFHDVIGIIIEVSGVNQVPLNTRQSSSINRNIFIKDFSDNTMKVTLRGNRARQFSYDSVYDPSNKSPIVVLFVGCLPKEFRGNTYLNGSAACHWYFNPAIQEAEPYYNKILSEKITLQLPPCSSQEIAPNEPPRREHKDLKDLLDFNPFEFPMSIHGCKCTVTITSIVEDRNWWYVDCGECPNKTTMEGTSYLCSHYGSTKHSFRYKLTFMASDGTAEAKMFCFDNIANAIIGKPCSSIIGSFNNTSTVPPEIAAIVSLKFTFAVVFNERSYYVSEKVFLIKSIVEAHGRDRCLPQMQSNTNPLCPSTPVKSTTAARSLDSPSMAMSKLSANASPSVSRVLTYAVPKDTIYPKDVQNKQATSQPRECNISKSDTKLSPFESPPKRLKQQDSKVQDELDTAKDTT